MTPQHQLTIVIPLYNGSAYLPTFLEYLDAQTLRPAKFLFIDDGSRDNSIDILRDHARFPYTLVQKSNTGLYDTLNVAANAVETEWVALLFQDDIATAHWVDRATAILSSNSTVDCLWFAIDTIDDKGSVLSRGLNTSRFEMIEPTDSARYSTLRRGTFWTISGSFLKTSMLREIGFRADLPHCGDFEFLLRALNTKTFAYLEEPLIQIRQHTGQASTSNLATGTDIKERLTVFREQKQAIPSSLRRELALRSLKHIVFRAAGQARRGNFRQAAVIMGLLRGLSPLL